MFYRFMCVDIYKRIKAIKLIEKKILRIYSCIYLLFCFYLFTVYAFKYFKIKLSSYLIIVSMSIVI